ncbi:MAG: hypothetical protein GC201_11530 [Alphaproteobacteria bacterium]|nr:hypothetical protein [Alphaproteobacteria bacterium]
MSKMDAYALWILEPRAPLGDAIWQDRLVWNRVEVIAVSEAFARLAAENWAQADRQPGPGNESSAAMAGFKDEKLYRATRTPLDPEATIPANGTGLVLKAEPLGAGTAVH